MKPLALLVVIAVPSATSPAAAEDTWNPFRERDQARSERAPKPPVVDRPALLPTMRGGDQLPASEDSQRTSPSTPVTATATPVDRTQPAGSDTVKRLPPPDERSRTVDRSELPAIEASQGVAAVGTDAREALRDMWQGLDARAVEGHVAKIDLPVQSPAIAAIWKQVIAAPGAPTGADAGDFEAFRLDRMLRAGLIDAASAVLGETSAASPIDGTNSPASGTLNRMFKAKAAITLGRVERGCEMQSELGKRRAELAVPVRAEILVLAGYCAAIAGNRAAAGLSAELAREDGATSGLALAALDAYAADVPMTGALPKAVTLAEYRFLHLGTAVEPRQIILQADASLLVAFARDTTLDGSIRALAAERAARANALDASELAEIYRATGAKGDGTNAPSAPLAPAGTATKPNAATEVASATAALAAAQRRSDTFRAADTEKTPPKRARLIRSLLDDARRADLYPQTLRALSNLVREMQIVPEFGWFAETAIEVLIADEKFDDARRIVELADRFDRPAGGDGIRHWLALIDIADPRVTGRRGDMLPSVEQLALKGRLTGPTLHRLATVLDALDTNVPIALWDAANQAPPPPKGYLPETGVLAELADASKKKQLGRTLLLSLRALGRGGPEAAELIALGDTIRALRRVGADQHARRVAFDALFAGWPRGT